MTTDQFPERKFSEQCWTHDLERLVVLAGLKAKRDADAAADPNLAAHWITVKASGRRVHTRRMDIPVRPQAETDRNVHPTVGRLFPAGRLRTGPSRGGM